MNIHDKIKKKREYNIMSSSIGSNTPEPSLHTNAPLSIPKQEESALNDASLLAAALTGAKETTESLLESSSYSPAAEEERASSATAFVAKDSSIDPDAEKKGGGSAYAEEPSAEVLPGINQIGASPSGMSWEFYTKLIQSLSKAQISQLEFARLSSEMQAQAAQIAADDQIEAGKKQQKISQTQAADSFTQAGTGFASTAAGAYIGLKGAPGDGTAEAEQAVAAGKNQVSGLEAAKTKALSTPIQKEVGQEAAQSRQIIKNAKTLREGGDVAEGDLTEASTLNHERAAKICQEKGDLDRDNGRLTNARNANSTDPAEKTAFDTLPDAPKSQAQRDGHLLKEYESLTDDQKATPPVSALDPRAYDDANTLSQFEKLPARGGTPEAVADQRQVLEGATQPVDADQEVRNAQITQDRDAIAGDETRLSHAKIAQDVQLSRDIETDLTLVPEGARLDKLTLHNDVETLKTTGKLEGADVEARTDRALQNMSPDERKQTIDTIDKELQTAKDTLEKNQGRLQGIESSRWQKISFVQNAFQAVYHTVSGALSMVRGELEREKAHLEANVQLAQANKGVSDSLLHSFQEQMSSLQRDLDAINQAFAAMGRS